jgi:phosphoribosylformylglycinamidine cyclo-ligase
MSSVRSDAYTRAGVNIDAADDLIRRISPLADSTRIPGAGAGLGGFGGVFDLGALQLPGVGGRLVSGTDGVGTKLKIAFETGVHDTIGIDCVAMCVNDILVTGARPLFFLDYFATGRLEPEVGAAVVRGVAEGCRQAGCWLLGGETAEMPGMYPPGEYDLAGFVVGILMEDRLVHPELCAAGDVVIGIPSSGLHSNGYSLARRVLFGLAGRSLRDPLPGDDLQLGARLLVPTRIYAGLMESMFALGIRPTSMAHITGGGLWENPQRSVPAHLGVHLDIEALRAMRMPVFAALSAWGNVSEQEMYRVFNMGVGLTMTVRSSDRDQTLRCLHELGETGARVIGHLARRDEKGPAVQISGVSEGPLSL